MANITNIVDSVIAKVNTHTTDITDIKESSLSKVASNVLLSGNLALASSAVTKSNANITYTGNGTSQSITTGISSVDFTVASNGSGYYHDRVAGDCIVKNDAGTIIESGSAVANVSKVHIKARSVIGSNHIFDSIKGFNTGIKTDSTDAEIDRTGVFSIQTVGCNVSSFVNTLNATYILHQTLYTHIKWGLTNQGKRYITAYNPVTREVMTMYQGSGIAGHQIPNALGIKLDFMASKNIDQIRDWTSEVRGVGRGGLNLIIQHDYDTWCNLESDDYIQLDTADNAINSADTYISYGFANSETKIITQYTGTGASGNFVETKDVNGVAKKPRRIIIKPTSATGDWAFFDGERGDFNYWLRLSSSAAENYTSNEYPINAKPNGFSVDNNGTGSNGSGVQYIAIVEFDTTGSNDDTYFDLPTDDTNLTLVNGKLVFTDGRASNGGYNVFTQSYTGSVDFSTCPDGIHYVALDSNNAPKFYEGVAIGLYDKTSADDNRLTFDTDEGKWYTTTGGELVTNGTFDSDATGWTAVGATLSVESGALKVTNVGTAGVAYIEVTGLEIGKTYKIIAEDIGGNTNYSSIHLSYTNLYTDAFYFVNSGGTVSAIELNTEVVAEQTSFFIILKNDIVTNGLYNLFDNISVYKKEATLDTPLTSPICFIDDKPYQITSETPMDRLVDYPSIPKNVMETLDVEFIKSRGNRKIIELGTIFNNTRYVIPWNEVDLPVDETNYEDCDVKAEVLVNGEWGESGWDNDSSAGNKKGVKANVMSIGIVVQTANSAVSYGLNAFVGSGFTNPTSLTSAPARVIVTYQGETK